MAEDVTAELVLRWAGGSLDLMGWNESAYGAFEIRTIANGTNWGSPESVRRTLRTAMLDGSRSTKERDDNRTLPLKLRVKAADGSALAGGEQALDLIDGRRCELVWTPPDAGAAASVFVVDFADLAHDMKDLAYKQGELFYTLTLDCLPHAYSDEWLEVPALARTPSTPTLIDDGSSTTNWSTDVGSLSASGGAVKVTLPTTVGSTGYVNMRRTAALDLSSEPYLRLVANQAPIWNYAPEVRVLVGSTWHLLTQVATESGARIYATSGWSAASAIEVRFRLDYVYTPADYTFSVDSLHKQATVTSATSREQIRTIDVPGSRRTPGEIVVESPSGAALDTVVVYAGPQYDPSLARRATFTRDAEVAGTASFTGARSLINATSAAPHAFRLPVNELPEGDYVLWARAKTTAAGHTLTITSRLLNSSGTVLSSVTYAEKPILAATTNYAVMPLGAGAICPWDLPADSTHQVELLFYLGGPADASYFNIDQLWAFNVTDGAFAIVEAGAASRVRLIPPNLDQDASSVLLDNGDSASALPASRTSQMPAWAGALQLKPPAVHLLTGALGAADAEVSARLRPAWNTHPPKLS